MSAQRSQALRNSAAARSIAAEQRARHAIAELDRRGQPVTFLAVAAEAGVSARYLYAHPQLRATIEQIRDEQHRAPCGRPDIPGQTTNRSAHGCAARWRSTSNSAPRTRGCATSSHSHTARSESSSSQAAKEHEMSEWPAPIAEQALHGPAGEFVRLIEPHTEADRATRGRTLRVSYADWRVD